MSWPILTWIVFLPLLGCLAILILRGNWRNAIRWTALLTAIIDFVLAVILFLNFDGANTEMQFTVGPFTWIKSFGVTFSLGVDGISILLVVLTPFLTAIAIASTWSAITEKVKGFMISMLLLQTGMLGVFVATDLFLFYVFWEVMLIPMYFMIGIWGGGRKIYAAVKFVLFTMFGSLLMLLAIIMLYTLTSPDPAMRTTDLMTVLSLKIDPGLQTWLFLAFGLAFAIKVPLFPFHTWLPDAHVEAPTAGSVMLAGVLLKMGTYGALVAMVQKDVKSLVAYSSVAHLGFVMLGMFALTTQGVTGSILQMVNHGIATGALFFLVGVVYERRHTRLIAEFGGLAHVMPLYATIFMIATLASIGLPGTNGFVGEFLILLGTFKANPVYAIIGTAGIVLAAVYMLWMVQRVFFGVCDKEENKKLTDMNWREALIAFPLIIMIFWIGIYPRTFLDKIEPSVKKVIETVKTKAAAEKSAFDLYEQPEEMKSAIQNGEETQWDSTGH